MYINLLKVSLGVTPNVTMLLRQQVTEKITSSEKIARLTMMERRH